MASLRLAQPRLPVLVAGVLLLHLLVLWAVQAGLLARASDVAPAVVQLSLVVPSPRPQSPTARLSAPPPAPAPRVTPPAPAAHVPAPAPANASVAAAAPVAAPAAPTLPLGALGVAAVTAPAPAAGLSQSTGQAHGAPAAAPAAPVGAPAPKVELPAVDAEYLQSPKVDYPRMSRNLREQGRVLVGVLIGADGQVQKAEVKGGSGFERLDQAALATVKGWRFVPGKRGGVPEAMWFNVPVNFVLSD